MRILRFGCLAALIAAFVPVGACDPGDSHGPHERTGGIGIVTSALNAASINHIDIMVMGLTTPSVTNTSLTQTSPGVWSGHVGPLADGLYEVRGTAFDASGLIVYTADANPVSVSNGQDAAVVLNFHGTSPIQPTFEDHAPFIGALTADSATVTPSQTIGIGALATDADNDPLTYAWTASAGTLTPASGASTQWTAPATTGPVTLTVSVDDGHGATSVGHMTITVANAVTGGITMSAIFFDPPVITGLTVSNGQPAFNEIVSTTITATGGSFFCPPDDALCHFGTPPNAFWTTDCTQTPFNINQPWAPGGTMPGPPFPPFDRIGAATCVITVQVRDAVGATATADITLQLTQPTGP